MKITWSAAASRSFPSATADGMLMPLLAGLLAIFPPQLGVASAAALAGSSSAKLMLAPPLLCHAGCAPRGSMRSAADGAEDPAALSEPPGPARGFGLMLTAPSRATPRLSRLSRELRSRRRSSRSEKSEVCVDASHFSRRNGNLCSPASVARGWLLGPTVHA